MSEEILPKSVLGRFPRRGKTAREVAERVGMSTRSAQRWTSEPREVYLARSETKRKKAQQLRKQGLSVRAIAAELGCSKSAVGRYINDK